MTLFSTAAYMKTGMGTVAFFAPEMVKGEVYNNKVDLWSLGVTLYNLLTLNLPVSEKCKLSSLQRINSMILWCF